MSAGRFRCHTDQVADNAAQLMKPVQAQQVTCEVTLTPETEPAR